MQMRDIPSHSVDPGARVRVCVCISVWRGGGGWWWCKFVYVGCSRVVCVLHTPYALDVLFVCIHVFWVGVGGLVGGGVCFASHSLGLHFHVIKHCN